MSSKKALKEKVQKLRTRNKLLRSDNLIERENLTYRATFAEARAERLTRENDSLKERLATYERGSHVAGHAGENTRTPEISNGAPNAGASQHAGNPPPPPEVSH